MNTKFEYLYRDGGNNKRYGEVIFAGRFNVGTEERLIAALSEEHGFIADQVRVPNRFLFMDLDGEPGYAYMESTDHCMHFYDSMKPTDEAPTDEHGRTIFEFVDEFVQESENGWEEFDPFERHVEKVYSVFHESDSDGSREVTVFKHEAHAEEYASSLAVADSEGDRKIKELHDSGKYAEVFERYQEMQMDHGFGSISVEAQQLVGRSM